MNSLDRNGCTVLQQLGMPGHARTDSGVSCILLEEWLSHFCFHCFVLLGLGVFKQKQTHRNRQTLGASEILLIQALVVPSYSHLFVTAKTSCKPQKHESPHRTLQTSFQLRCKCMSFPKDFDSSTSGPRIFLMKLKRRQKGKLIKRLFCLFDLRRELSSIFIETLGRGSCLFNLSL